MMYFCSGPPMQFLSGVDTAGFRMAEKPSDLTSGGSILSSGRCRAVEAHSVERKLAAIFAADVAGYSALMGRDEVGTPSARSRLTGSLSIA